MAELVGGALLSAFLEAVFDRLTSEATLDLFRGNKLVIKLLDELNTVLISANKLLNDAEEKQIADDQVKKWLDKLRDTVYRADDLTDSIDTKASLRRLDAGSIRRKVLKSFLRFDSSSGFDSHVKNEAREILDRLKVLLEQRVVLGLREGVQSKLSSQRPSVPLPDESGVYGRQGDKDAIIDVLLSDGQDGIFVVPIVGMGGIGKTTLTQLVYDDDKVVKHFEIRAWVTVSDEFDIFEITKMLLERVTLGKREKEVESLSLFELQRSLKEALKEKRFLFVFDDVWNENYNLWNDLKSAFGSGKCGSKIIATSRSANVASIMADGRSAHRLSDLSPNDCWCIFTRHAFGGNANNHPNLEAIGREIVNKCKGLPLAIKSLGGLLRSERNPKKWENILKSDVWNKVYRKEGNILPALWLSYRHMPTHLKRCFSYCSIFPKDHEFEKEGIILLWMAEGFLQSDREGSTTMEELGEEYFEDLLSRSLFQRSKDKSIFLMHDLIHDLAIFVSGPFCSGPDYSNNFQSQTRYFSYHRGCMHKHFEGLSNAKYLRTFIQLPSLKMSKTFGFSHDTHKMLLTSTRFLRVLCLQGSSIKYLSDTIGCLIHLRYLDLSHSKVTHLHSSICSLYNLQTLLLSWCRSLEALPKNMEMLANLRHLDIQGVPLKEMPIQLSRLKSLQSLSKIVVGVGNRGPKISALREVKPFSGSLEIVSIENIACAAEAKEASLKDKCGLTSLILRWSSRSEKDKEVLDSLRPHTNLRDLMIVGYGGSAFSDWVCHNSFSHVVSITLEQCKSCRFLPPLGELPSLKELFIIGLHGVVSVGDEFHGNNQSQSESFRCLERLWIGDMSEWKDWSLDLAGKAFPRLTYLFLRRCPKLQITTPSPAITVFPSLVEVWFDKCPELESNILDLLPSSKLECLSSYYCKKLFQGRDLHGISSLRKLIISGWEGDTFPGDMLFLPEGLVTLEIVNSNDLVSLNGEAFRRLTRLDIMCIHNCSQLLCLPEERLPESLSTLQIWNCRLLTERCQRGHGEDWCKIAHIPHVNVYDETSRKKTLRSRLKIYT